MEATARGEAVQGFALPGGRHVDGAGGIGYRAYAGEASVHAQVLEVPDAAGGVGLSADAVLLGGHGVGVVEVVVGHGVGAEKDELLDVAVTPHGQNVGVAVEQTLRHHALPKGEGVLVVVGLDVEKVVLPASVRRLVEDEALQGAVPPLALQLEGGHAAGDEVNGAIYSRYGQSLSAVEVDGAPVVGHSVSPRRCLLCLRLVLAPHNPESEKVFKHDICVFIYSVFMPVSLT